MTDLLLTFYIIIGAWNILCLTFLVARKLFREYKQKKEKDKK